MLNNWWVGVEIKTGACYHAQMKKKGKIIPNGVSLESHEYETILVFTELGYDVSLIPKSNLKGVHTADIIINGEQWEMKCPRGSGRWLLENTLKKASRQSENIIIDLARVKIHQAKCIKELEKQFYKIKQIRKMLIVTKSKKVIDYAK